MIKDAIFQLARRENLSYDTARAVMDEIMSGQASDIQMSAYLTAMSMKGETIEEITASAAGMRQHCIKLLHDMDVLEIVGTGGDGSNSFNISTTAALVVAAAGVPVAKHGNRAASSKCGAADVLEAFHLSTKTTFTMFKFIKWETWNLSNHIVKSWFKHGIICTSDWVNHFIKCQTNSDLGCQFGDWVTSCF